MRALDIEADGASHRREVYLVMNELRHRRGSGHRARGARFAGAAVIVVATVAWGMSAAAHADVSDFELEPTSGPPSTLVHVSGGDCTPGIAPSSTTDYVAVAVPMLSTWRQAPTAADGSWRTSFTVPADAAPGPALVTALCISGGLPALSTIYAPGTFTVTATPSAAVTTTTRQPPQQGTGAPTPTTRAPGTTSGGSTPATRGTPRIGAPEATTVPGTPPSTGTMPGTTTAPTPSRRVTTTHPSNDRPVAAADLHTPTLSSGIPTGPGRLNWLGWTLMALLAAGTVGGGGWLLWSRRRGAAPVSSTGSS